MASSTHILTGPHLSFGAAPGQVGGEFAVSVAEQQRQLDALKTLDAGLSSAALVFPAAFEVRT